MVKKIMTYLLLALSFTPAVVSGSIYWGVSSAKILFVVSIIFLVNVLFAISFFHKNEFRDNILEKINKIYKNPIFLSISVFLSSILLSSIFAFDKFSAFWGDVERAEGFVGIFVLAQIFIFTLLIFEKKDWFNFIKLNLFVAIVLVSKSSFDFLNGIERSDSLLGNPSFLSGYLIFSIFSSLYVFWQSKNKYWRYFSFITFLISLLGIFLSQTRGTILAIFISFVVVLVFVLLQKGSIVYRQINLKKVSVAFLVAIVLFTGIFLITKQNIFWQKIPGVSRMAQISTTDATTNTRLINIKTSLRAMNPSLNGYKKLLIGWGQDNFIVAYFKNFDPKQLDYEGGDFDRSHNKLLDVFVMNGLLGLLAYILIFIFLFRFIFSRKYPFPIRAMLLFWATAYLIHLLFLFDQISTYLALFFILAFVLYYSDLNNEEVSVSKISINNKIIFIVFFLIVSIVNIYVFFFNYLPGYLQLHRFNYLTNGKYEKAFKNPDNLFYPYTFAQSTIRKDFLKAVDLAYIKNNTDSEKLIKLGFSKGEEYLEKNPWDLRFVSYLATAYTNTGHLSKNIEYTKRGKDYFKILLGFSPERPDYNLGLALSLYNEKDYHNSLVYFEKAFDIDPKLYSLDKKAIEKIYVQLFMAFYKEKNLEDFKKVSERLKINDYSKSKLLDQILEFINIKGRWPNIVFE